jgi:hypothetical protein
MPPVRKCLGALRANSDNLSISFYKLLIIATQLRHMPAAERSDEAAIKYQNDILFTLEIR